MLVKNHRLNVSIGIVYKEVPKFWKTVTKMLILILEMFYDFVCEEGQDLSLFMGTWRKKFKVNLSTDLKRCQVLPKDFESWAGCSEKHI